MKVHNRSSKKFVELIPFIMYFLIVLLFQALSPNTDPLYLLLTLSVSSPLGHFRDSKFYYFTSFNK